VPLYATIYTYSYKDYTVIIDFTAKLYITVARYTNPNADKITRRNLFYFRSNRIERIIIVYYIGNNLYIKKAFYIEDYTIIINFTTKLYIITARRTNLNTDKITRRNPFYFKSNRIERTSLFSLYYNIRIRYLFYYY
jgi:hypothetical protein